MKIFSSRYYRGFTFPEIIIVLGILALLLSVATVSILQSQRRTTLATRLSTLVSDIRTQQFQAMSGDTGASGVQSDYGIHFESNSYTLFKGSTYNSADTNNFVVEFDDDVLIENINLANNNLIFTKISGEILSYNASANSITLKDLTNGEDKVIEFNSLGVISEIQ